MRKTLQEIFTKYGPIAVVVYLSLFTLVLGISYFAIRLGWTPSGAVGSVGVFTAAYLVTKITQPLRIAATVVLTPLIGGFWKKGGEGRLSKTDVVPPEL